MRASCCSRERGWFLGLQQRMGLVLAAVHPKPRLQSPFPYPPLPSPVPPILCSGLPPSLRRLRMHYEPYLGTQAPGFDEGMGYGLTLLELPDTARQAGLLPVQWLKVKACPHAQTREDNQSH